MMTPSRRYRPMLAVLGALSAALQAGPVLTVDSGEKDFGTVRSGTQVTVAFTLRNTGDAALTVKRARTSCSTCAVLSAPAEPIAVGGSAQIRVMMDTGGMRGTVRRFIYVESDDPDHPAAALVLRGVVQPAWELTPTPVFVLPGLAAEQPRRWSFTLSTPDAAPFRITECRMPEGLTAEFDGTREATDHALSVLSDGRSRPAGLMQRAAFVRTTSPSLPLIRIPVVARIEGTLAAVPAGIILGVPDAGTAAGQRLVPPAVALFRVSAADGRPFEVTAVKTPDPAVHAAVVRTLPGGGVIVRAVLEGVPRRQEGHLGDIAVETDLAGAQALRVPVIVQPARPVPTAEEDTESALTTVRSEVGPEAVLDAVSQVYDTPVEGLRAADTRAESRDVAIWLADRLCPGDRRRTALRQLLGGMTITEYARARDRVTLRMKRDEPFARHCRSLLGQLSGEDLTGADGALLQAPEGK